MIQLLDQGVDVTDRRERRGHATASAVVLDPVSLGDRTGADLALCGNSFRDKAPAWMGITLAPES